MTDTTVHYGWEMPSEDGEDYQNVNNIRNPLIAIDQLLYSKLSDSGVDVTGITSSEAGWVNSNGASSARLKNGMCQVRLAYSRSGIAIVSSTTSGAVGDSHICTTGTQFRPDVPMINACMYGGTNLGGVILYPDGKIYFFHGAPGVDLGIGDTLYSSFFFIA